MPDKSKIRLPEAPPAVSSVRKSVRTGSNQDSDEQVKVPAASVSKNAIPPSSKLPPKLAATESNPRSQSRAHGLPSPRRSTTQGLPPELPDEIVREFIVKMGGFFFGEKYRLVVTRSKLRFVNLKSGLELVFDPSVEYHDFTLRNPWTSGSDEHLIFETKKRARFAFTIPVRAWPTLRDWWNHVKR